MLHIGIFLKCDSNRFSKSCIHSARWIFYISANYRDYRDLERAASKHIIVLVLLFKPISFLPGRLSLETRKEEGGHVLRHNCVGGYPVASQIKIHFSKVMSLLWPKN